MYFGNPDLAVEAQRLNRDTLIQALTQLGVARVTITYSGSGDSGDVCQVEATPPEPRRQFPETSIPFVYVCPEYQDSNVTYVMQFQHQSLEESLRDFALNWVELHHGGWENNEGGEGEVTIDVPGNAFTLDHHAFYTERDHYGYTL